MEIIMSKIKLKFDKEYNDNSLNEFIYINKGDIETLGVRHIKVTFPENSVIAEFIKTDFNEWKLKNVKLDY